MSSFSKSLRLSSSFGEEIMMVPKKQGIVSILGSDVERTNSAAASLRRTLSADMSSKKWQAQHGFYPLKKIASSDHFPACNNITDSSSSEDEDFEDRPKETGTPGQFHIWSSIQADKNKKEVEKPGQFDVWSSIISEKAKEEFKNAQPYVHPLVKRSASSLSEKSLEICTESLGSETGSDGFSSYPSSETGDAEEDKEEEQRQERVTQKLDMEDLRVEKYNLAAASSKKSQPRSFPPPIPSLSSRDGASVRMRSRRDNGRLVLEAVSVPSQNNFHAQRQDGRLVLTFVNTANEEEEEERQKNEQMSDMEQFDVEIENSEDEEEAEEEIDEEVEDGEDERGREEARFVMEEAPKLSSGVISVHRLALMMNKSLVLANRNPTRTNKFHDMAKFGEDVEVVDPITPVTQSLPPRPPAGRMITSPPPATIAATATAAKAAASFNACEYFWKPKPVTTTSVLNRRTQKQASSLESTQDNKLALSKKFVPNEQQELVVLRGNKGDCLVPLLKSCKETRKSLLFWEPHCIATS
ncbi:unnamed protein product [Dovyalis caffra]|uniref:FAF domain-containing protein n=1 Tax=Dovyalis caffra TaxID=77055 RepID=A0AAV1RDF3_9ROSI|nr:unnamed protein product [Dovyalis caffra]